MNYTREKLLNGNRRYLVSSNSNLRIDTAENGQKPYAVVLCCSDSRVIPEKIFDADIGELFVIRVAGNVLDNHQMGSIEYALKHLNCNHIIVLGHTGCGAVHAAITKKGDGFIKHITDEICKAIGDEKDEYNACKLNALYAANRLKTELLENSSASNIVIECAIYDMKSGEVEWL